MSLLCAAVLVTGCGSPPRREVSSLSNRDNIPPTLESPARPAANRCYAAGRRAPDPAAETISAETTKTNCRPLLEKKVVATEQSLLRSYKRRFGHSRVIVDFPCDAVEQITEIELEFAEEAGWLTLIQFAGDPKSGDYDVRAVQLRAPMQPAAAYDYRSAAQFQVKTASIQLGGAQLDLDGVRTPFAATINEVLFADGMLDLSGFSGGPQIRRRLRLQGRNRHHVRGSDGLLQVEEFTPAATERSYTGEAESLAQKDYLPIELAAKPLLAAVPAEAFGSTADDAHRRLIRDAFVLSFDAAPPWLREQYLVLAAHLGTRDMIPKLVEVATHGPQAQAVLAVGALAAITGWDARFDAQGAPRPVSAVAADYAKECSTGLQATNATAPLHD